MYSITTLYSIAIIIIHQIEFEYRVACSIQFYNTKIKNAVSSYYYDNNYHRDAHKIYINIIIEVFPLYEHCVNVTDVI